MSLQNYLSKGETPVVGKHVFCCSNGPEGKGPAMSWATIQKINEDGTIELNVHDKGGSITHGMSSCKPATDGVTNVPGTWWPVG